MQESGSSSFKLSLDWNNLFKSDTCIDTNMLLDLITCYRNNVRFITGSSYIGKWNILGMNGYGSYIFPHGSEYQGNFEDGRFHGEGTINFPMGQKLICRWHKGQMISYKFCHIDGLKQTNEWSYCAMPDRRFLVSMIKGLQPAGREHKTNQQPSRPIMHGSWYDTVDGFYNPNLRCFIPDRDPDEFEGLYEGDSVEIVKTAHVEDYWVEAINIVPEKLDKWVKKHCRKGWDEPAGYTPNFYEDWISGRRKEIEELESRYKEKSGEDRNELDVMELQKMLLATRDHVSEVPIKYASTGRKLQVKDRFK